MRPGHRGRGHSARAGPRGGQCRRPRRPQASECRRPQWPRSHNGGERAATQPHIATTWSTWCVVPEEPCVPTNVPAAAVSRDALEGEGPRRRPRRRVGRRLEGVAKAVGGGYCRLQMPLKLALAVRKTVAGRRLGALEGGGGEGTFAPSNVSLAVSCADASLCVCVRVCVCVCATASGRGGAGTPHPQKAMPPPASMAAFHCHRPGAQAEGVGSGCTRRVWGPWPWPHRPGRPYVGPHGGWSPRIVTQTRPKALRKASGEPQFFTNFQMPPHTPHNGGPEKFFLGSTSKTSKAMKLGSKPGGSGQNLRCLNPHPPPQTKAVPSHEGRRGQN